MDKNIYLSEIFLNEITILNEGFLSAIVDRAVNKIVSIMHRIHKKYKEFYTNILKYFKKLKVAVYVAIANIKKICLKIKDVFINAIIKKNTEKLKEIFKYIQKKVSVEATEKTSGLGGNILKSAIWTFGLFLFHTALQTLLFIIFDVSVEEQLKGIIPPSKTILVHAILAVCVAPFSEEISKNIAIKRNNVAYIHVFAWSEFLLYIYQYGLSPIIILGRVYAVLFHYFTNFIQRIGFKAYPESKLPLYLSIFVHALWNFGSVFFYYS